MIKKIYYKVKFLKNRLRINLYKFLGASFEEGVISYGRFTVVNPSNLSIGKNTTINEGVHFNCRDKVIIGKNVHISSNTQIHTGYLIIDSNPRIHDKKTIIIEDNVWIATNATILAGVRIGRNSIIAAGSIVTKDIDDNSLVMGIPGKVVKKLC